VLPLHH